MLCVIAGTIEAARDQIPLIAAYALSVHKSQGEYVCVH